MAEYKYNAKKVAYNTKYVKEHYDRVELRLPTGYKQKLKKAADAKGVSVNVLLKDIIDNAL